MKKQKRGQAKYKKQDFFRKQYNLSWEYIKESRKYFAIVLILLLFSIILGIFYQPKEVSDLISQYLKNLVSQIEGLGLGQMIIFILKNNLSASFFSMILGMALGIFPLLTGFFNGYVLGFVAENTSAIEGYSILLRLLPHGIFEFPALIISLALGIKLGMFIFAREKKKEFLRRLIESLRIFLFVIIPLLVIAAIIEGSLMFILI